MGSISRLQLSEGVTAAGAASGTRKAELGNWPSPLHLTSHSEAPGNLRELELALEICMYWSLQVPGLSSFSERGREDAMSEQPHGK